MVNKDYLKRKAYHQEWYRKNKVKTLERMKKWRLDNPEKYKQNIIKNNAKRCLYNYEYNHRPDVKIQKRKNFIKFKDRYNENKRKFYSENNKELRLRNNLYVKTGVFISNSDAVKNYKELKKIEK